MKLNYPIIIKFDQNGLPKNVICPDLKIQYKIKNWQTFRDDFEHKLQNYLNHQLTATNSKIVLPSEIKHLPTSKNKSIKISSVELTIPINKGCYTRLIPAIALTNALLTGGSNAILDIVTLKMSSGSDEVGYIGTTLAMLVYLMVFYGAGTITASVEIGNLLDNLSKYNIETLLASKNKCQKYLKYSLYFLGTVALIMRNLITSTTYYKECTALRDRAAELKDFEGSFFANETNMNIVAWLFAISSFISGIMFQGNLFGKIVSRAINFFTPSENSEDKILEPFKELSKEINLNDEKDNSEVELTKLLNKPTDESEVPLLGTQSKHMCIFL